MIKPTAPKTYQVLHEILLKKVFTQREIAENTKVSLGQVNKIVNWLEDKKYVSHPGVKYQLEQPIAILNLFALFRKMNDNLTSSLELKVTENELNNYLKEKKTDITLCLTSALKHYSSYFRDSSINFYTNQKEIINDLTNAAKAKSSGSSINLQAINIYTPDLFLKSDRVAVGSIPVTSDIRTVIDLFCDGKAYAAKDLIKNLWGVTFG